MSRYVVFDVTVYVRDRGNRPVNPCIETGVISGQGFGNISRASLRLARVLLQKSSKAASAAGLRHVEILLQVEVT